MLFWIVIATMVAGCGARRTGEPAPREAAARVVNHGWSDVRVYIYRDGARDLLGMVVAGATAEFPVSPEMVSAGGSLRLVADPVGARASFETETFTLAPGDVVEWTIRPAPDQSSLVVY